jgi:protein ImuA
MSTSVTRSGTEELRERIRRLEGAPGRRRLVLPFGIKAIDRHLPGGGLALGALHEVAGGGNGAINGAAAALFAAGVVARLRGRVLWCLTRQDLFAPALAQAGLIPDRVIYVEAGDEKSVLICFEEGLRHGGLGAAVAKVARLSMTASRRLQLSAEGSGTIGIAIHRSGGRRRRPISGSQRHPSPAGASARSPQPRCRCLALDALDGSCLLRVAGLVRA